jgi:adenosyl cobinamide kinase/adenosyl cobinamide phosphate guanylyltransferase
MRHAVKAVTGVRHAKHENSDSECSEDSETNFDKDLYKRVTREDTEEASELEDHEERVQEQWNALAAYLEQQKLKNLKSADFPVTIDVTEQTLTLPIFEGSEKLKQVIVQKRFSSRKLPHLLTLVNETDEKVLYIFKEDDDISMDVAVMELLTLANEVWESRKCPAHLQTYNVVSTPNNTGFCECIDGETMLVSDNDTMLKQLGRDPEQWENFYYSMIGVIVATAAFDITDRHDNNALFSPHGDIALIDLSASLGQKAPMDLVLMMNPIYFPVRFKQLHRDYRRLSGDEPISRKLGWKFWDEVEEDAMVSYYSLYNNYSLRNVLKECHYSMPPPINFLKKLNERKHKNAQRKEKLRNGIVQNMEDSDKVSKFVSTVCHILPGN